jgi:hypothetical protein
MNDLRMNQSVVVVLSKLNCTLTLVSRQFGINQ